MSPPRYTVNWPQAEHGDVRANLRVPATLSIRIWQDRQRWQFDASVKRADGLKAPVPRGDASHYPGATFDVDSHGARGSAATEADARRLVEEWLAGVVS